MRKGRPLHVPEYNEKLTETIYTTRDPVLTHFLATKLRNNGSNYIIKNTDRASTQTELLRRQTDNTCTITRSRDNLPHGRQTTRADEPWLNPDNSDQSYRY